MIHITSIGGGTGNYPVNRALYLLKTCPSDYGLSGYDLGLATLVGILDRGGSSGRLLRQ